MHFFIQSDSYTQFKDPDKLFLFGRRGTGKTNMIRMLDYEIQNGTVARYGRSWVLDTTDLILNVAAAVRNTPLASLKTAELSSSVEPFWRWYIQLCAMVAHVLTSRDFPGESPEAKILRAYLKGLLPAKWEVNPRRCLRNLAEHMLAEAVAGESRTAGQSVADVAARFTEPAHREAERALQEVLREPCVIQLDSGEVYGIRDDTTKGVVSSLINSIQDLSSDWAGVGLYCKAAFPSEVEPHLYLFNRGKTASKTVVIHWSYRALVSFIAKRLQHYIDPQTKAREFEALSDFGAARELVYRYFPATVVTKVGVEFDTLSYLIRHTQKTPRQVLVLCNAILTEPDQRTLHLSQLSSNPDAIVNSVHSQIDHVVKDALDTHRTMYSGATDVIRKVLSGSHNYFPSRELDQLLRQVSELRHQLELERVDVRRLLLESGAIGIAREAHRLEGDRWLLQATYEYQIKDTLEIPLDGLCVVHPMFHEWLQSEVDAEVLTYPVPYEDEERVALAQLGVPPAAR